jgi:Arylsulfotransferase (ASST)
MLSHDVPTPDGDETAKADASPAGKETIPAPRRSWVFRWASFFGLVSLGYVLGAAVIFFDLPTSSFLRRAFVGGAAWYEVKNAAPPAWKTLPRPVGKIDMPDKTCDGFTLCMYGGDSRAFLINMHGKLVHQWHVPFSKLWTDPPHLRTPINDEAVYFNDGHIYPNGDLLVVIEGPINLHNSSNGYGLAKLDRDSNILWKYAAKCHHDLDVGEDGTIYVLTNEIVETVPSMLDGIPTPCMVDQVHVISPEGKPLKKIALLEAIHSSPYRALLGQFETARTMDDRSPARPEDPRLSPFANNVRNRDVLHTNSVKVLSRKLAPKFSLFKEGHLLVSLRHINTIAILDPNTEKVVWAARGPWLAEHDPSFLDNGHLLLFDNLGSSRGSRVLEYDPQTQSFPWSYPGENDPPFRSQIRGMCQRLPNGNTLIVNSVGSEVFEVTADHEVVWSCTCGGLELNRARRYMPHQLLFLKGGQRARP